MRTKGWLVTIALAGLLAIFWTMFSASFQYAEQGLGQRLERLESEGPE